MRIKNYLLGTLLGASLLLPPGAAAKLLTLKGVEPVRPVSTAAKKADRAAKVAAEKAAANKYAYGWLISETRYEDEDDDPFVPGYASIGLSAGSVTVQMESKNKSFAGAYDGKLYYAYTFSQSSSTNYSPVALVSVDPAAATKTETVVKDYSTMSVAFNDMTFDHSTSTMYAVAAQSATNSELGTVDRTSGDYKAVHSLTKAYLTLAATYAGELYGIDTEANLYKIDKATGKETLVGSTGVSLGAAYNQSMDFDHTDETLWWAETDSRGSNLYKVDVTSGKATKVCTLGYYDDAQITGLYVPYTIISNDAPAAVSNLKATPKDKANIVLTWTNPTTTKGGAPLQSIEKVVISCNGEELMTSPQQTPGKEVTCTHSHNYNGWGTNKVTYTVTVYNAAGAGPEASVTGVQGEDYPGAVQNVRTEKVDGKLKLTWDAPTTGEYGGWFDTSTLAYQVYRGSDSLIDNLTETTFTDALENVEPGYYKYRIKTKTASKPFGTDYYTDYIYVGEAETVPQYYTFDADGFKKWNVIDANDDGDEWTQAFESERNAAQMYAENAASDDWLISRPLKLEAGKKYRVKFDAFTYYTFFPGDMTVNLLKDGITANKTELKSLHIDNTVYAPFAIEFTVAESGEYSIGFHSTTAQSGRIYIADPAVENFYAKDVAATELVAPTKPIAAKEYRITATVANNGSQPQSDYSVELVKTEGETETVIATAKGTKTLATDETEEVVFNIAFDKEGTFTLKARTKLAGDEYAANDETAAQAVEVRPAGSDDLVEIGKREDTYAFLPIGFVNESTVAQSIYLQSEINKGAASIKRIAWPYKFNTSISDVHVDIYLANTEETSLKDAFLPKEAWTKVYSGNISMTGDNTDQMLEIALDKPYFYTGKGLAVMTHKSDDKTMTRYGGGYTTRDNVNKERTRSWSYSKTGQEFPYGTSGMTSDAVPDIVFYAEVDCATLNGTVTTDGTTPAEGATVTLQELGISATADAEGKYAFSYVPEGTFTAVVALADGSESLTESLTFKKGDNLVKNFQFGVSGINAAKEVATTVYPVPANHTLYVRGAYDSIRIVNNAGATVLTADGSDRAIAVDALQAGFYNALITKDGKTSVRKIIIRH